MTKSKHIVFLIALLAIFVFVPTASAHRPEEGEEGAITQIPNTSTSFAYYRELQTAQNVHVYSFYGTEGEFFHAGINIPQLDGLEEFGVSLALLGPELPAVDLTTLPDLSAYSSQDNAEHDHPDMNLIANLDFDVFGSMVIPSVKSESFYEPFTQTDYWGRQTLELDLPATGSYFLLIWNPNGETGKYVLDTGYEEVFGPTDMFRFPIWWVETRMYFEQTPYLTGAGLSLVGVIGFIFIKRRSTVKVSEEQS